MNDVLDSIRTRPRFKFECEYLPEEFSERLKIRLQQSENFGGSINREVSIIYVKTDHNNYWKPQLSMRSEIEEENNNTVIRGVFGPSAAVWTFFMFLYFLFGIGFMVFATIFLIVKQLHSPDFDWAIYVAIFCLIMLISTYVATFIGQRFGRREMALLRTFAENTLLPMQKEKNSLI